MLAVEAAVRGYARRLARTKRPGESWRCSTTSTTSDTRSRRTILPRGRGPEGAGISRLAHACDSVACRLQRRARETPARESALSPATRCPASSTAAALVRPSQERPRPRSLVGNEADEGQGLRPRGQAATICAAAPRNSGSRSKTRRQRDSIPARAGRGARIEGNALMATASVEPRPSRAMIVCDLSVSARLPATDMPRGAAPVVSLDAVSVGYGRIGRCATSPPLPSRRRRACSVPTARARAR